MIRRVKVQGYKSLRNVDVALKPLTIVLGPNAAGKSNLFDSLSLLSRMVTSRNLREAFEDHRGAPIDAFFYGSNGLEDLLAKPSAELLIEVDVTLDDAVVDAVEHSIQDMRKGLGGEVTTDSSHKRRVSERNLRYSLRIEILTETGHLRVRDEKLAPIRDDGEIKQSRKPFIERDAERQDKLILRMEGQAHPSYHDIGLDHTLASTPLYAPHYPHITAFREELSRWRFYYLEPKRLMRSDNDLKEVYYLDSAGENLAAFYNSLRARNERQFEAVNRTLPALLPRIEKIDVTRTQTGELQLRVFEGGIPFPASIVSEGTLRVLGLLSIANAMRPATVVGYEEPENGVHPRRLKLIAQLLEQAAESAETQFLINTHSPDFPSYFSNAWLVNCRRCGPETVFEPLTTGLFKDLGTESGFQEDEGDGDQVRAMTLPERIRRGDFSG